MSLTQQSRSIAELSQLGWSRDKIAAELGVSTTFIFRSLKMVAEMPVRPVAPPKPVEHVVQPMVAPPVVKLPTPKAIDLIFDRPRRGSAPPSYLPTPEEIADQCAEIQATWTSRERRYRLPRASRWSVPEMRCVDFCEG